MMTRDPSSLRRRLLRVPRAYGYLEKFAICEGVARGTTTLTEAMEAHRLSVEEWTRWYDIYKRDGLEGFRNINRQKARRRSTAA